MDQECYGSVGRSPVAIGPVLRDSQLQLIVVGFDDLGFLIGDKAAELLHSDFDRHRRDERGFNDRAAAQRAEWPPTSLYLLIDHSVAQLNDLIAALILGLKQCAVGSPKHCFR